MTRYTFNTLAMLVAAVAILTVTFADIYHTL
jgi:hypothetical protein